MKNTIKTFLAALVIIPFAAGIFSCAKKTDTPGETCQTCIARSLEQETIIKQEQECTADDVANFKLTYSDYSVSCH